MKKHKFTYEKSGVSINAADNFVKFISNISTKNKGNKKFKNIGGFGSISNIPRNFKKPKIVASTDGVGTKIEIANILNKFAFEDVEKIIFINRTNEKKIIYSLFELFNFFLICIFYTNEKT